MRTRTSILQTLPAALLCLVSPAFGQVTHDTRALSGNPAPGTGAGVLFSSFGNPAVNAEGEVAFTSILAGTGVVSTNNTGIWSDGSGTLTLVVREGEAAPGTGSGPVFESFGSPLHSGTGQMAFSSFLTGSGVVSSNNTASFSGMVGALDLLAREGEAAPGTGAGIVYTLAGAPLLNAAGETAFNGSLSGPGVGGINDSGVWSKTGGPLTLVIREGDPAPGTATGVVFSTIFNPVFNGAGQTAFAAFLAGAGVGDTNDSGVWSEGSGSLDLVARENEPAPGAGAGVLFSFFSNPTFNDAGQTAFRGFLMGTGVGSTNDTGIWSEGGGSLELIAQEGDPAPGTDVGVTFNSLLDPVINGAGKTAFLATLQGTGVGTTNDSALWFTTGGSPSQLVREGDPAPGTPTGVVHGSLFVPVINTVGQIAFIGLLSGPGIGSTNNRAVWLTDSNGDRHLVARLGDPFDVSDDPATNDFRTISVISMYTGSGGQDGKATSLNDAGQLAMRLDFTDGSSGVFVAEIASTGPAAPILDIDVNGNLADISFDTEIGFEYQLQSKPAITNGWSDSGSLFPGTGTNETISVLISGDEEYFRVEVQ